jgi:hypothetical protein
VVRVTPDEKQEIAEAVRRLNESMPGTNLSMNQAMKALLYRGIATLEAAANAQAT